MINPKTDEELLNEVLDLDDPDQKSERLKVVPNQGVYASRTVQIELINRTSVLERQHQEIMIRMVSRETLIDERMIGLLRRMETVNKTVDACVAQFSSFRSFSNLVQMGTGVSAAIVIDVIRHFLK